MSSTWKRLIEMIEATNWSRVNQKKNMQRWGTQDRNAPGPTAIDALRKAAAAGRPQQPPSMVPKKGGLQIPSGTDRPGQGNPLVAPPGGSRLAAGGRASQTSIGGTSMSGGGAPSDHGMEDDEWLQMLYADDEDDEG